MQRIEFSGTSVAANLTGFATNVTGATWALSATNSADSLAHKVTIKNNSVTDHSAKTITLTGTDANGKVLIETLAAPGTSATVTSVNYFLTLTGATVSATIGADTFNIGWAAASASGYYYPKQNGIPTFNIGIGCRVGTGTPTFSIQHTYDGVGWLDHSVITGKTASIDGVYTSPVLAIRLAFSVAGQVFATGYQFGA